jgi:hypothetical protein
LIFGYKSCQLELHIKRYPLTAHWRIFGGYIQKKGYQLRYNSTLDNECWLSVSRINARLEDLDYSFNRLGSSLTENVRCISMAEDIA